MNQIKEVWLDVSGYEGKYKVSNKGYVKSLKGKGRILSLCDGGVGYKTVTLYFEGAKTTKRVHQLVAVAFHNHIPNGHNIVVDHINGVKTDNRASNLQLITTRENLSKDKKGGTSDYVGVVWFKLTNKWVSRISINHKLIHLGYFDIEEEASNMYKKALENINLYKGQAKAFRYIIDALTN